MLKPLFSFYGRLGRLSFLLWSIAGIVLVTLIGVGFLMLGGTLARFLPAGGAGPQVLGIAMAIVSFVIGLWATLALAAKRIRDAGFAPLPILIGFMALSALDSALLTRLTEIRFFWPFQSATPVGGLLGIAFTVFLLFWPGADGATPVAPRAPGSQHDPVPARSGSGFGQRTIRR